MMFDSTTAVLVGAGLATCGWLYGARRARTLSKKQHTVNVMLQASFNKEFREALRTVGAVVQATKKANSVCPDLNADEHRELRLAVRMVANHYEFLAAGLRNGDFDERLVKDSQRGQILNLWEFFQDFFWKLRDARRRRTIYEHLEWLYTRWEKKPPKPAQVIAERCLGRPFAGKRVNPHYGL